MTPIYIIGDIHGNWSAVKDKISRYDLKNCVLIAAGDIGVGFKHPIKENSVFSKLNLFFSQRNIEFLAIRGNHDDPSYFGKVKLSNFELLPDYTYRTFNNKLFLFVGGAISIDRLFRVLNRSWWPNEDFVLHPELVQKCDVLITHSAPSWIGPFDKAGISGFCDKDFSLWDDCKKERYAHDELFKLAQPSRSFAGHFHSSYHAEHNGCMATILAEHEIVEYHNV